MNQKRFPEKFKSEAVRQIVESGNAVAEVSARLGVSTQCLQKWMKEELFPNRGAAAPEAELKRVAEEHDILKRPPCTLPSSPGG
jgi:transposase